MKHVVFTILNVGLSSSFQGKMRKKFLRNYFFPMRVNKVHIRGQQNAFGEKFIKIRDWKRKEKNSIT